MKIMLNFLFHSEIFRLSTFNLKSIIENFKNEVIFGGFQISMVRSVGKKN
jgi:hypothetical protein